MKGLLASIVAEVLGVVNPLVRAGSDAWLLDELLRQLGTDTATVDSETLRDALEAVTEASEMLEGLADGVAASLEEVGGGLAEVNDLVASVRGLASADPVEVPQLGAELLELLVLRRLRLRAPVLYQCAWLLGAIECEVLVPAGVPVERFSFDRFRALMTDPAAELRRQWPVAPLETTEGVAETMDLMALRVGGFLTALGVPWVYGFPEGSSAVLGDAAAYVERALMVYAPESLVGDSVEAGICFSLSSAEEDDLGIVVSPIGTLSGARDYARWSVGLAVTAGVDAVSFGGGTGFRILASPGTSQFAASIEASALSDAGDEWVIGSASGTRVEVRGLRVAAEANVSDGDAGVRISLDVERAAFVITSDSADGFVKDVLGSHEVRADIGLGLIYSNALGLRLRGGAGLATQASETVSVGPVSLDDVGISVVADGEGVRLLATCALHVRLGPVTVRVEGIGTALGISRALTCALTFQPPQGAGVAISSAGVAGGGHLTYDSATKRYSGALSLVVGGLTLSAFGALETQLPQGGYSLVASVSGEFTPVQLGLGFTLSGVGGVIGVNRRIDTDALVTAVRGPGIGDIFFADNPVAQAARLVGDLARYFPTAHDRYVFGPAVKVGWGTPTIVEGMLALLLEVPAPVRLVLLGKVKTALPTKDNPVIVLNVDVVGEVDFSRKAVAIDASLHDSKVAGFPITGDLAFRMGWGDPPSFVLSVGGFHSQFRAPPGFPELRRVNIPIGSGDNPRLDLKGFLALTSNTAQVGAEAHLYAAAAGFNIEGALGFETLIQFSPFALSVALWADVAFRRGSTVLASVHVDGTLTGPTPWHLVGHASVSLWHYELSIAFDATFGRTESVELPQREIWPLLRDSLQMAGNWGSALPPMAARAVTTAPPVDEDTPQTRIDPGSTLTVRQKVVPLNRQIERFAQVEPVGVDRFEFDEVTLGGDPVPDASVRRIRDWFAPAQFEAMSDAQRLSRAGYEKLVAGIEIASDEVQLGPELVKPLEYETIVFPAPEPLPERYRPTREAQVAAVATGAMANAPLRVGAVGMFAPATGTPPMMVLEEEEFVIASTEDLTARLDIIAAASRSEAELAFEAYLAENPGARGQLQVVPRCEVAELMP